MDKKYNIIDLFNVSFGGMRQVDEDFTKSLGPMEPLILTSLQSTKGGASL